MLMPLQVFLQMVALVQALTSRGNAWFAATPYSEALHRAEHVVFASVSLQHTLGTRGASRRNLNISACCLEDMGVIVVTSSGQGIQPQRLAASELKRLGFEVADLTCGLAMMELAEGGFWSASTDGWWPSQLVMAFGAMRSRKRAMR